MIGCAPRVLVADDDPDARHILSTYLTHHGYQVLAAADGVQAWRLAGTNDIDISLLDVVMPGLSGVELLERLETLESAPEVILLTAYATVAQAVEAMKRGAFDYLQKPFSPRQVLALLAEGKTDGEMAEGVGVSVRTINTHVSGIGSKLRVSGRLQAALMWQQVAFKGKNP